MKKRFISLLLAAFMVTGLLSGCGSKNNGEVSSESQTPTQAEVQANTPEPGKLPIVDKPEKLTIGLIADAGVTDYDTNYYTQYLEKNTGLDLEFYFFPSTETEQKLELMVAANEKLPDIILNMELTDAAKASYGKQGVFLALNDFMDKYSYYWKQSYDKYCTDSEKSQISTLMKSPDGNIYGYPFYDVDPTDTQVETLYINQKWLDKLGLQKPTTLDELYNVLVAFRDNDPNGNGKKDEIPMVGYNSVDTRGDLIFILMQSFLYYNWSEYGRFVANDGKLSVPYNTPEFREGLKFINKLYSEKLIAPVSFTQDYKQLRAMVDLPKDRETIVGVVAHHPWSGSQGFTYTDPNYDKLTEYTAIGPLKGPNGVAWSAYKLSGLAFNSYITRDCKNPEMAFRLLDFMSSEEASLTSRRGEKGVDWDYCKEGEKGQYEKLGYSAKYTVLHDIWAETEQNKNYHIEVHFLPAALFAAFTQKNYTTEIEKKRDALYLDGFYNRFGKYPKEVVTNLVYTDEEMQQINETATTITAYADEARVRFVTGDLSIDKDWDKYVSDLNVMGLNEWLKVAQSAYDRMHK